MELIPNALQSIPSLGLVYSAACTIGYRVQSLLPPQIQRDKQRLTQMCLRINCP